MPSASYISGIRAPLKLAVWLSLLCAMAAFGSRPTFRAAPKSSTAAASRAARRLSRAQQQRLAQQKPAQTGAIEGVVRDAADGRPVLAANAILLDMASGTARKKITDADGVFRFIDLPPSNYELEVKHDGYESYDERAIELRPTQVLDREIRMKSLAPLPASPSPQLPESPEVKMSATPAAAPSAAAAPTYPGVLEELQQQIEAQLPAGVEAAPPASVVAQADPDRWNIPMPEWRRYATPGEYPYVQGQKSNSFNRNKWKGDYPMFGRQTFLNFTAESDTLFDGRRLPTPSNVSTARPGEPGFFGKGEQAFLDQEFVFSVDLFHGDTSFRPADWRIRFTPVISLNYLAVQELGVVNVSVAKGTARFDSHVGLQEAFAEYKIADLSANYDFVSVRAGIQKFNSDFRGFIFSEAQPGLRIFGNYDSNRWQYNLAYFNFLEKNTNSDLNSMALRNQQVIVANVYRQDFLFPGYTTEFSVHYSMDQATVHYDDNGFLVRPAPVGSVVSSGAIRAHSIHAAYLGWAGDGHIGRLNVSHAFYQALGNDSFNPLAGRPVSIDAQMAALELSVDKDWARFKASVFYASGDGNPAGGRAHGFDSIDDLPEFAGGIFSLWNREGIRLTGSGVLLTAPNSILPDLRSSKFEGQANFVNPGILLYNLGTNLNLTPKLRGFVNVNYLQFMRTAPLELLLFQGNIQRPIGYDYSAGVRYRPPLTENVTLTAGAAALSPGAGFREIYGGKTLFSVFTDLRFQF